jgi:hypothetical protein
VSASINTTVPLPTVPVTNAAGQTDFAWEQFFLKLWLRTGGAPGVYGVPGGVNGNVQYNKAGQFGGYTDVQLTTHIQEFTNSTSGAVPAYGSSPATDVLTPSGWAAVPASLIVDDEYSHTISPTGALTFEGVVVSGTSPSAIVNMATITGTAGTGIGSGGNVLIQGGPSGNGATGNGGQLFLQGGTPLSTNGDGGIVVVTGANATGNGNGGSVILVGGSATSGLPGSVQLESQFLFLFGTPSVGAGASITGTDQTGLITVGSGATTSVPVTFGGGWQFPPLAIVISPANAAAAGAGVAAYVDPGSVSDSGWTLSGTALANCAFYYHAF